MRKIIYTLITMMLIILALYGPANAGDPAMKRGMGIYGGYSINPDQIVIGGQAILGTLKGDIDFSPSVDFGFGDHLTVVTVNFDASLNLFKAPGSKMKIYVGAGPTLGIYDPEYGSGDTEIGLTLLGGVKIAAGEKNFYNIVGRIGLGDIPDFKILFGYMFGLGSKSK